MTPSPEIVNTTSMWHYSACRHVGEVSKREENMFHAKQLHPSPSLQSNNTEKKCFMKKGFSQRELYGLESVGKELPDFLMQRYIFGETSSSLIWGQLGHSGSWS